MLCDLIAIYVIMELSYLCTFFVVYFQLLLLFVFGFYVRKQLLLSAHLSHRNSLRLSVTRVDQAKRFKLGSPNLHRWLPGRL